MGRIGIVVFTLGLAGSGLTLASAPAGAAVGDMVFYSSAEVVRPQGITTGPDGNLWFSIENDPLTDDGDDPIGRLDPDTGLITTFTDPAENVVNPDAITTGPDGNLWFGTEAGRFGRLDPDDGSIATFAPAVASHVQSPRGITAGPDGNVWFTSEGFEGASGRPVGFIDPNDGTITTFDDGATDLNSPFGMTVGPDGAIWFTSSFTDEIARIDPDDPSGTITDFDAGGIGPRDITVGPDGNIWYAGFGGVGRLNPDNTVTTFSDPGVGAIFQITSAPDGNLWFVDFTNDQIGRVTTSGVFTTFSSPGIFEPYGITVGPDCQVWFTSRGLNQIGRLDIGVPSCAPTTPGPPTNVTVVAGNGSATVSFDPPVSDGGSPITSYTATCGTQSATGPSSPIVVSGLTNGEAVQCTVVANNAAGAGPSSPPSSVVTPVAEATALVAEPAVLKLALLSLRLSIINASATLETQPGDVPLAGQTITFRAGSQSLCSATTDASGFAKCPAVTVGGILATVLAGGYDATFAGTPSYLASSAHGPLVGG